VAALPLAPDASGHRQLVEALNGSGFAVIGTPDDAIAQIRRLAEKSGGFGTYLLMAHDWADEAETRRSFELFSRHVMPELQRSARTLVASRDWAAENRPTFIGAATEAVKTAIERHREEHEKEQAG
jgi:limonene 1,2-monooxygenase